MRMHSFRTPSSMIIAAAALCAAVGCQTKTYQEAKEAAVGRWQTMRSAMIIKEAQGKFETGDLDEAERKLLEAARVDPRNPALFTLLGRIGLERGMLDRANSYFLAAIEVDGDYAEAHYYRGLVLQRWQRYGDAYDEYAKAYELSADNASYLLAMSEMLIALEDEDRALAILQEKQVYFEGNAGIRVAMAQICMMKGQMREACDYYRQALVLEPDNLRIVEELALAQMAAGENLDAIQNLRRLLAHPQHSDRTDLRRQLAVAYVAVGRVTDARDIYYQLTRLNPSDVEAWISLGETAWRLNDLAGALTAANRIISLAPQRHEGYLLAGMVWHRREKLEQTLQHLDRAAELAPQMTAPWIVRGLALEAAGRKSAAAQAYREALKRNPADSRARSLLSSLTSSSR